MEETKDLKKKYSPPDIAFESFSLSASVAACAVGTNFAEGECGYQFAPGIILFMSGVGACLVPIQDGSPVFDGLCYHNPTDMNALFNS